MGGRGSSSITRSQEPRQARGRLTIGGKVFSIPSQIDAHYSNEYRKSREMLETNNAMNRILGTSGGIRIGGKVFTTDRQLRNYYKKEAEKSKEILRNLQG